MPSEMQNELRTALAAAPANPRAETRARDMIESAGALVYLAIEAERHYSRAVGELRAANPLPSGRDRLAELLEMTRLSRQG